MDMLTNPTYWLAAGLMAFALMVNVFANALLKASEASKAERAQMRARKAAASETPAPAKRKPLRAHRRTLDSNASRSAQRRSLRR